jgi:hypothetical protein
MSFPYLIWPTMVPQGGTWAFTNTRINATGQLVAFVFQVDYSGTLDWFEWRTGTVTNNPDNGVKTSFMTVDPATGNPDGVVDEFRDNPAALSANTWQVPAGVMTSDGTNGGVKRTVTAGEWLACVMGNVTFTAGDDWYVATLNIGTGFALGSAYLTTYNGASWAKQTGNGIVVALRYSDGTYRIIRGDNAWPAVSVSSVNFNSGSTPDERALRFQVPRRARVKGVAYRGTLAGDADFVLYDGASNVLATVSADKDIRNGTTSIWNTVFFSSSVWVQANTTYRLAMKPTSGTNVSLQEFSAGANARLGGLVTGVEGYLSTRTDGGAWTDTNADVPLLSLIFDDIGGGSAATFTG